MNKLIATFLVLIASMISGFSYAEDQPQPPKNTTTKKVLVYKKRSTKPDISRAPGMTFILETIIENNEITFFPSFWGEGMSVKISDNDGNEWNDFVTPEEPAMFFDGQTGTFYIECLTVEGATYIGEFDL